MSVIEVPGPFAALAPRARYLPRTGAHGFVIGDHEPVAVALQRITTQQFTVAIDALTGSPADPGADLGAAVLEARAALDRIAAILRLVREAIGETAYRTELAVLRETGALLAGLVAGRAEIGALDHLRARYEPLLRPFVFSDLQSRLTQRHQLLRLTHLGQLTGLEPTGRGEAFGSSGGAAIDGVVDGSLRSAVQQLRRARARFAAWPVDQPMYDRDPVPDSFSTFAVGLERTYRAGRRQWQASERAERAAEAVALGTGNKEPARAEKGRAAKRRAKTGDVVEVTTTDGSNAGSGRTRPDPEKWRLRVRDLGHQLELLSSAWPDVLTATNATCRRLGATLADDHAIATLRAATSTHADMEPVERDLLESICDHERQELAGIAVVLGSRLYREKPATFVDRIGSYWESRG